MRVAVVGASGYVGAHLCRHLAGKGHEVLGIARSLGKLPEGCPGATPRSWDLAGMQDLLAGFSPDAVVNLAAAGVHPGDRDPAALARVNALLPGELVIAASATGARALVHIGSSAEYAPAAHDAQPQLLDEQAPLEQERAYGRTKALGSLLAAGLGRQMGLPVAVLRLFNVFGPGEPAHRLLPSLARALREGREVALSPGSQMRDFIGIARVCDGIRAAIEGLVRDPSRSGIYNLASSQPTSVAAFAREVASVLGADEGLLKFGAIPMRPDDLPWVVGASDRMAQAFGWRYAQPLAESLREALGEAPIAMASAVSGRV